MEHEQGEWERKRTQHTAAGCGAFAEHGKAMLCGPHYPIDEMTSTKLCSKYKVAQHDFILSNEV